MAALTSGTIGLQYQMIQNRITGKPLDNNLIPAFLLNATGALVGAGGGTVLNVNNNPITAVAWNVGVSSIKNVAEQSLTHPDYLNLEEFVAYTLIGVSPGDMVIPLI